MRKGNQNIFRRIFVLIISCIFLTVIRLEAQTINTTVGTTNYTGGNGVSGNSCITFVIENNSGAGILLTQVGQYFQTASNGTNVSLWYSSTSLSGAPTITTPVWTQIATGGPIAVPAEGVQSLFTGLSFLIPDATQYRFAIQSSTNIRYSGASPVPSPSSFTVGGVTLKCGDVQIGGANIGYGGAFPTPPSANNPRWFTGFITFGPAAACTAPPVAGTSVVSPAGPVCTGAAVNLGLTGNSTGTGQTYQWESASAIGGPYSPLSGVLTSSSYNFNAPSTSTYYRCVVTCSGNSQTSTPVQLVVNPAFPGGTYSINSAQATGGTNFQTFAAAVNALSCGISGPVIFNVDPASGPYNEQVIIPPVGGASAVNTITFNGNGRTLTFNSTTSAQRAVLKLDGADYITINNLVITAPGTLTTEYGYGVQMINDADNNTISNCTININTSSTSTTNYCGVLINSTPTAIITAGSSLCDNNTITGNTITGGYAGIAVVANTNTSEVNDNIITNNIIRDFHLYGIYLNGNNSTLVEGNNISRPVRSTLTEFRGIYMTANSRNCRISKNRIHNPFDGNLAQNSICLGINLNLVNASAGSENIISNNLIYNMNSNQTTANLNGLLINNSTFAKVYHNTITLDHTTAVATTGGTRGIYVQAPVANNGLEFRNNIVVVSRGGAGPKECIYFENTGIILSSNNNVLLMTSTTGTPRLGFANGTGYNTLAAWQAGTGQDGLSVSADPVFLNPPSGDYTPTSAAVSDIGVATVPAITTDINNTARNAVSPDPGAYEFSLAPCVAPPTPGTATVSNAIVCQNTAIILNLTGNSFGSSQTYQWESSPTIAGTYSPVSGVLISPGYTHILGTTAYFRCAVTCSGNTQYSVPVLATAIPGLAGPYTINSNVATGGTNFQSFAAAISALSCGITAPVVFTVDPASGPYNEQVIMTPVAGSSPVNTITFNGNGRTLSYLSTNSNERAVIKLNGADNIIFNDLVITATGTGATEYGYGVQLMNSADSNVINNCTININTTSNSTTNYAGIVMSASATSPITTGTVLCDYNTFSNNTITGGYYGITMVGSTTSANFSNKVINNTIQDFYLTGVYVNGTGASLVEGNNISRPTRTSVSTFNGIYFTSLNVLANVTRNKIHDPFGGVPTSTSDFYGIYFTGVDALSGIENVVSNNLIYNTTSGGDLYGLYNSSSDNVRYYHNTINLDGTGAGTAAADFTRGFHQVTAAAGIDFANNIITISRGGPSQKTAMYFSTTITASNIITSNRNDFFLNSGSGTQNVGFFNGAAQATLANWQTASTQDANSFSVNPLYTDPLTGDFKPTNATIDNRGNAVTPAITIDINGDARSATTPDLGAYEFTPAVCVAPPVPGTATVSLTPACVNSSVQLGLNGNSIGLTQTYQWQVATAIGGPYNNIGNVMPYPDTTIITSSTLYYRVAVTCSGITEFSAPVLLTVTPALPAGTYVIDQTNGPGTDFLSFNEAKAAMACGIAGPVIFNVAAGSGPYLEQLVLDSIAGTSAVNTITFNGNGETIRFTSTTANRRAVITLNGTDYTGFYNLVISAPGTTTTEYGVGVQMLNNADNNTVNNCTIEINTSSTSTTNYAGVIINGSETSITGTGTSLCDNNTVSFNTITGGFAGVAVVANGSTSVVHNNKVLYNTIRDYHTYGIYVNGTNNLLVEGNNISRPVRDNSGTTGYGIYFTGISGNGKISKNRVHAPYGGMAGTANDFQGIVLTGVDAPSGSENIISNNAVYNINSNGLIYGIYNTGSDNAAYYHNTISLDHTASTSTEVTRGFYQTTLATGLKYKNNIVTISRGGTAAKHAMYMGTTTTTYESDYNNFYVDPAVTTGYVGFSTANQLTLANWQTATAKDANSLSVEPLYSNMAAGNLQPNFAPLDDQGTPVVPAITTDILSLARSSTTPDIGAWEFAVQPCVAPPVAGTPNAVPNTGICIGTPIQLSLTGNSTGAGQSYQWEYSTSATGPWNPLGAPMLIPDTIIEASGLFYYRVSVTCSGNTQSSTSVQVNINPPFPAGTYTIDKNNPTTWPGAGVGSNFNSFAEAVAVMNCGIAGKVTFNVLPNTYTEQVRMHAIAGTSPSSTVTFQSQNGDPASVILTYDLTAATNNYVLQLDSASYIIYKNMTINAVGTTSARAVELARTASNDTLTNLIINVPLSTGTSNAVAGIVGTALTGSNNVIKGNTINNGSSGINITGNSLALPATNLVIDSNTVNGSFYYSIYTSNTSRSKVQRNIVTMTSPRNTTTYGIYGTNSDSAYEYVGNVIDINSLTSTTSYGLYLTICDASVAQPGRVANNKISAVTGNTGVLYGMYQTGTTNNNTVNNVIVINTTGASSYGIYSTGGGLNKYYNNSVNSVATSATNNYAAYFTNTTGNGVDVRNNIFSHRAGGRPMYVSNTSYVYSDYNMLYTTGTILVQRATPAGTFNTLDAWRSASSSDLNSIVYPPAFTSMTNLMPNLNDPDVWAIHGRGEQIAGNDYDFNNNARATTVVAGVPDLGAYEFLPTIAPPVLPATPAAPAAGTTQVFMFGTDTVTKIAWKPASTVPSTVSVRRYSGVTPPGMAATAKYMYFYTDVDVTASTAPNYEIKQYYIDPWQGLIPRELVTRLGRTNATGAWTLDSVSTVDSVKNILYRDTLNFLDKFTGMTDSTIQAPPPPPDVISIDSSNSGRKFWVAYPINQLNANTSQEMVLYLSATQAANVQVKIHGTNWVRNYSVPANSVVPTEYLPKAGFNNAFHNAPGFTERGISITSDVPIVAYAHYIGNTSSGASMLMPVSVWGHEYKTLCITQDYGANSFSYYYVIADKDSTRIEIISAPGIALQNPGMTPGVPFVVTLNKGEVYQVVAASQTEELSGSIVRSVPNDQGNCYAFASFSGSSRTAIDCPGGAASGGDFIMQQNFPSQAWGKRYLTAPSSSSTAANQLQTNIYRVAVKDPTTVVRRNGVVMAPLINNFYYQFNSNTADYIEADKPIMVAQFFADGGCPGSGVGDPEMIYLSPIEQGIKQVAFYRNDEESITTNYLTMIVPTNGVASLSIVDGATPVTPDYTYPHPQNALTGNNYTVVVKRWTSAKQQVQVRSDSAFTAITYGLGSVESYGYNAGTLIKNLNAVGTISNVLASNGSEIAYTCVGTPFKFKIRLNVKPTSLVWHFSQVPGLSPNADSTQISPVPVDSVLVGSQWYYNFTINQEFTITNVGAFVMPATITHPSIEGCNSKLDFTVLITVLPAPVVDYTYTFTGCVNDVAQFNGTSVTSNSVPTNNWSWNFGDATTSILQNPTKSWSVPGTYNVSLRGIADDGCIDTTAKPIVVSLPPVVNVSPDSLAACNGSIVTFTVQNPETGAVYSWYDAATGGALVHTGNSYTFTVTGPVSYYAEAVSASGCISSVRKKVTVVILPNLLIPVVTVDTPGTNMLRFRWNAIPNATGYEVSIDNGNTWSAPSSGLTGLTHTVTGLQVNQIVTIIVRALGGCLPAVSLPVSGQTVSDQVFIPNTFTPNGNGPAENERLRVYSNVIRQMRFAIFNQWGEKIFETTSQSAGWDGTYKGKPQPSGVYMYVCDMTLADGSKIQRKGSINLIR